MTDHQFLQRAIDNAKESIAQGGFPAGAIVVKNGEVLGEGVSIGNILHDPTSHGETAAIRMACKNLNTSDLSGAVLYASMEPCLLCLGAALWSGIGKIVYAIPKERVSVDYYGGPYKLDDINAGLTKPIERIHDAELEAASMAVVREWETSIATK